MLEYWLAIMGKTIYRIVHTPEGLLEGNSTRPDRVGSVAKNLNELAQKGRDGEEDVSFVYDETDISDMTHNDRGARVVVGGGMRERCVATYVMKLHDAGFTNIKVPDDLTISETDLNRD